MTDKDYIEHAISCILFQHKYDDSYKITKEAEEKESKLFNGSIQFLRKLALDNKEEPTTNFSEIEQEFINKAKGLKKGEVENLEMSRAEIVIKFRSHFNNGFIIDGHTWTYPYPSLNLIEEIRKISEEW